MRRKKTAESTATKPAKSSRTKKTAESTATPAKIADGCAKRMTPRTNKGAEANQRATTVKGADLKPIRKRNAKPAAPSIPPLTYDVTRHDAVLAITSPNKGRKTCYLKVETQPANASFCPGKRMAWMLTEVKVSGVLGDTWKPFAFVDEFGVHCWGRLKSSGEEPSFWEKLCGMLEQPSLYINKGCTYKIDPIV